MGFYQPGVFLPTDEILRTLGEGTFGKVTCSLDRYDPATVCVCYCSPSMAVCVVYGGSTPSIRPVVFLLDQKYI